jgi:hypothetical protein
MNISKLLLIHHIKTSKSSDKGKLFGDDRGY